MKIIILIQLALISIQTKAFAGPDMIGNGGDVLVCRDSANAITSVELLDLYDAGTKGWGISITNDLPIKDYKEIFLKNLSLYDNYHAQQIRKHWNKFTKKNIAYLSNSKLTDIPDSGHLHFPNGCVVEQLVIQKKPTRVGDKLFTISKDLWVHMDNLNKAATRLHEIIFYYLLESKKEYKDSNDVRYLTSLTVSDSLSLLTPKEYFELSSALGANSVEFFKHAETRIHSLVYDENGNLEPQFHSSTAINDIRVDFGHSILFDINENTNFSTTKRDAGLVQINISGEREKISFIDVLSRASSLKSQILFIPHIGNLRTPLQTTSLELRSIFIKNPIIGEKPIAVEELKVNLDKELGQSYSVNGLKIQAGGHLNVTYSKEFKKILKVTNVRIETSSGERGVVLKCDTLEFHEDHSICLKASDLASDGDWHTAKASTTFTDKVKYLDKLLIDTNGRFLKGFQYNINSRFPTLSYNLEFQFYDCGSRDIVDK